MRIEPADVMGRLPQQFFASLTSRAARLAQSGRDIINLGQGNPDLPTPAHIVGALQQAVEDPSTHRYPPFRGLAELREAICTFYAKEYNVSLDPTREVAVLFGGKAGLVEISQCLLSPQDLALVPDPGYPDYLSGIAIAGAGYATLPLREENGFLPVYADVDEDVARRAKLLFLNYPNNPTAAVADSAFFAQTVRFARQHQIVVAHDFAYGALGFSGAQPSFLQTPGAKEVGVEFYTLSKTYNMAGWRVGFALGNEEVIELLNALQDHYFVSLFPGIQKAAALALTADQTCVSSLRDEYRRRRNAFLEELRALHYPRVLPAPGSFFVWLPTPRASSAVAFAELLMEEEGVVVAPGVGFGEMGEGYVRVAMLAPETRLREAARRIAKVASRL